MIHKLIISIFILITTQLINAKILPQVIYGTDDRTELNEVNDLEIISLGQSVANLVSKKNVSESESKLKYSLKTENHGEYRKLCEEERFYHQKEAAGCTSFLISEDTMVTAGHCINESNCSSKYIIFNLIESPELNYNQIPKENIYECKKVITSSYKPDYAVFQLDRPVAGKTPLKVNYEDNLTLDDKLLMIGHPTGLPLKVNQGVNIITLDQDTLLTDSDSYGGNSGSPLINHNTHEVEGILVSGAKDYIYDLKRGCANSHKCDSVGKSQKCTGETVTKIHNILTR